MNIFLSCVKLKQTKTCEAQDMYVSDLFKKSLEYAKTLNGHIYILSAKYGVLELTDIINPYNQTLNEMKIVERKAWAKRVYSQLQEKSIDFSEHAVFLCGNNYREFLLPYFKDVELPLEGLGIGEQLHWYLENTPNNGIQQISLF